MSGPDYAAEMLGAMGSGKPLVVDDAADVAEMFSTMEFSKPLVAADTAGAAEQLEQIGLVPSDDEKTSAEPAQAEPVQAESAEPESAEPESAEPEPAQAEPAQAEQDFSAKPSTRRAEYNCNLALQGLPTTFEAVQQQFDTAGPSDTPRDVMTDDQVSELLAYMDKTTASRYSWSTPRTYRPPHHSTDIDDIDDRLTTVQDTLGDLETAVASVDTTTTEIDTAVGSLAEDAENLKEAVREVQTEVQLLAAQVASVQDTLAEIKAILMK